jgi:tetratricopeptide (TPR) repeat protein
MIVEEKSSKPPGQPKFSRRPNTNTFHIQHETPDQVNERLSAPGICRQMLMDGFVQSYVDFYHLTHRHDDKVDANSEVSAGQNQAALAHNVPLNVVVTKLPPDELGFIRDNLVQAEISRRQGDTTHVYQAYNNLADHYVQRKDWKTGFFFHEKCLEVAQLTNDVRAEMSAHHSLGVINQLMFNYERARVHHEKHEALAASVDVFEEVSKANAELYKVYSILAERFETAGAIDEALEMFNRCTEAAKKSWDKSAEAEANGRIGTLMLNRGQITESIPHLKIQSQLAADLGNPEARCRACSALALAYELLGQAEKALTELQLVHTVSEQSGDQYLQAQACRALGTLYSKVGRLDAAVDILQRHFTLLKGLMAKAAPAGAGKAPANQPSLNNSRTKKLTSSDLDLARAYIGISKGNQLMGIYVVSLEYDLTALLDWKLNRSDLLRAQQLRDQQSPSQQQQISNSADQLQSVTSTQDSHPFSPDTNAADAAHPKHNNDANDLGTIATNDDDEMAALHAAHSPANKDPSRLDDSSSVGES